MEKKMRDMPMLDSDRENLRNEIEGFDDMTLDEVRAAVSKYMDNMLDIMNLVHGKYESK